jgi:hypothetical protein
MDSFSEKNLSKLTVPEPLILYVAMVQPNSDSQYNSNKNDDDVDPRLESPGVYSREIDAYIGIYNYLLGQNIHINNIPKEILGDISKIRAFLVEVCDQKEINFNVGYFEFHLNK